MASDRETPPDPIRPPRPKAHTLRHGLTLPSAGSGPGADDAIRVREEEEATSREGRLLVQVSDAEQARDDALQRAADFEKELRAQRRKSAPRVDSEPPPSNGDRALGKGVRLVAGYLVSLVLAGGAGAGGVTLARPAATPQQADATAARVAALEARAVKAEDELSRERAERAKQGAFNDSVASWISRLAAQQQIKARQPESAPPPVGLVPERMPGDRARSGPLWRAEESLPEPP